MRHGDTAAKRRTVQVNSLSRHFVRRWNERVGASPSLAKVNQILAESCRIRKQMRCMVRRFGGLVPRKVLAEYWHHERGMILLVDEERGMAVTVLTANGGGR